MSEKTSSTKKKPTKVKEPVGVKTTKKEETKKVEKLDEVYTYKGEGELIQDKPTQPLQVTPPIQQIKTLSNKDTFNALVTDGTDFTLSYMGSLIYDSVGKLNKVFKDLKFEEEYFILYGDKYSYDGLSLSFKR